MALFTVSTGAVISPNDVNQITNILNGTTTGTTITNSGRIRAQVSGSNSMTGGYVGQTAGLPPSASFVTGDFASDGTLGFLWSCIAGGVPGTWIGSMAGITETVLGSPTASVTFSSIPQGYAHLVLVLQVKSSLTTGSFVNDNPKVSFNGVTTSGYNYTSIFNTNSSTASATFGGSQNAIFLGACWTSFPANTVGSGNYLIVIPYYSQADFGKNLLEVSYASDGGGASQLNMTGGCQNIITSMAAVTSITLTLASGSNFVTGSFLGLYGIA